MLSDLVHHLEPFAYTRAGAVDADLLAALDAAWSGEPGWVRYDSFYRCWIAEVSAAVRVPTALVEEVAAHLDQPLAEAVRVTLQRMAPGDGATVHTDRPLLGYESARLVIQLTPGWTADDGGAFAVCTAEGEVLRRHLPRRGTAVLFALHEHAHHAVEPCRRERRTAVLHFWHVGNRPPLRAWLAARLEAASFAELPRALHPAMDAAEATRPEVETLRMGTAALLALRLGLDEAAVCRAYAGEGADGELLAHFAGLWVGEPFDASRWPALCALAQGAEPRLVPLLAVGGLSRR